jgi:AcrR family transcriptional regulator
MSFGNITKEMDMEKGNLYHYFKSKEAILDGVATNCIEHIQKMLKIWEMNSQNPKHI